MADREWFCDCGREADGERLCQRCQLAERDEEQIADEFAPEVADEDECDDSPVPLSEKRDHG